MRSSFKTESSELRLKIKAKDDQLRSANTYLETMSSERETDRLEIIELTQALTQERRKRDVEKRQMDDLKQQVGHFFFHTYLLTYLNE